jgi:hypothetical protein
MLTDNVTKPLVAEQLQSGAWAQEPVGDHIALRRTRAIQAVWRWDYKELAAIAQKMKIAARD